MKMKLMLGALLMAGAAVAVFGQTITSPPGKFFSTEQWKKMMDEDKPANQAMVGQTAKIIPPEYFIIRRRNAGANNASVHSKAVDGAEFSEIYYIIEGTGEFVTGGTYDPKNRTAGIQGGDKHTFKPGDVMVIPMGTAHWFAKIDGHVMYIQARYPGNVLTLGK